jgi:hypothetical protein
MTNLDAPAASNGGTVQTTPTSSESGLRLVSEV